MKVLVTGINGFAGCHLSRLLAEKGYEVFGTRINDLNIDVLEQHLPPENLVICDLRDSDKVEALIVDTKPDAVFHLAGQSWVPASWKDPAATFNVNLIGSIHLFESMMKNVPESPCAFISTGDLYDMASSPDAAVDEKSPVLPRNPYALSKMTTEMLASQLFQSQKLQVITLRPFNHIGPCQSENFVVSDFARQIALAELGRTEPVLRVGDLDVERDFTDVRDMARAYEVAIHKCGVGECYNISAQKTYSISSILDILLAKSTVKMSIEIDPAKHRPGEIHRFLGNSEKFRSTTGWTPDIPIEKTVGDVLNYWRERSKDG